jgi:hypothetical protein
MPTGNVVQMEDQIPTLLRCLGRNTDPLYWPSGETDWQPFAKACEYHQVTPFVFCQLKCLARDVPAGLLAHLRQRYFEISARNYHLAKQAVEIASDLGDHGIAAIAFKGPATAIVAYGNIALRQYQDIDLIIGASDLPKAVDLLIRHGFQLAPESCRPDQPKEISRTHEVTLAAPDKSYFVDLHWRLATEREGAFCPNLESILDRVDPIDLPSGKILALGREDQFVALSCHGTKHRWARLKWLLDIAEILQRPEGLDWNRVERITFGRPLARAATRLAILLAHQLLNAPMPAALPRTLEITARTRSVASAIQVEIFARGHTNGLDHLHSTLPHLEGSIRAWMAYLWARYPKWFFEHAVLRIDSKDRALLSLPRPLAFLYHIIRPIRLVAKHSTRVTRLALASMGNSDQQV